MQTSLPMVVGSLMPSVRFSQQPVSRQPAEQSADAAQPDLLTLQGDEVRWRDLGDRHALDGNYSEAERFYEAANDLIPQIQALQATQPELEGI
jgi:hypothetical protein